jgi:hypothetical protein
LTTSQQKELLGVTDELIVIDNPKVPPRRDEDQRAKKG